MTKKLKILPSSKQMRQLTYRVNLFLCSCAQYSLTVRHWREDVSILLRDIFHLDLEFEDHSSCGSLFPSANLCDPKVGRLG